jgi:hypothetical protein
MNEPVHFAPSPYAPLAMSFFGISLGYIIMGGAKAFNYPPQSRPVSRAMGIWALYGPGVVQSVSAVILLVGLTWFGVFEHKPPMYAIALAFLAMAAHWLAMGVTRIRGADTDLEAWMGFPMLAVSALTAWVFFAANDVPIAIGFVLLVLVYAADIVRAFHLFAAADRVQGSAQFIAGWWMLYLAYAVTLTLTGTLRAWI